MRTAHKGAAAFKVGVSPDRDGPRRIASKSNVQARRCLSATVVAIAIMAALGACTGTEAGNTSGRTIKVLSTRDDGPASGVDVVIRAVIFPLGQNGPEYVLDELQLTTDEHGEVHVDPPLFSTLHVMPQSNMEYGSASDTVRHYEMVQAHYYDSNLYYMTPSVDMNYEAIRYHYRFASDLMDGKTVVGGGALNPIVTVVGGYELSRRVAKTQRELEAMKSFCRFSSAIKAEAEAGWPNIGPSEEHRQQARMLIEYCGSGG